MVSSSEWPEWWDWPLEITAHLLRRMEERNFSETDLRGMIEDARSAIPDVDSGRWLIRSSYDGYSWEIVVEPEESTRTIVAITAYRTSE